MTDIDQILERILPWFQPHIFSRVYIPEIEGSFDIKIIFESASPEFEEEYADEGRRVLRYILDFRVQTYLFKPVETTGVVGSIFVNFYTNLDAFGHARSASQTNSTFTSGASGESLHLLGVSSYGVDDTKIYDYEIYQFGTKTGNTIRYGEPSVPSAAHPIFIPDVKGEL
jgi:hypothetical protein